MRFLAPALVALTAVSVAGPARAADPGAWQSHTRPYHYRALLAEGDTLWAATLESGLIRYADRPGGGFTSFHRAPGRLSSNRLTALALDAVGRLWVATDAAGVSRLSPDRRSWTLVSAFDGLPSDSVTTLSRQGDSMWVGTTRGVALWNGREIAGAIPNGFDPSPFANDHVTGIVARGDSLWLATLGGVYVGRISAGFPSWSLVVDGLFSPQVLGLGIAGTTVMAYGDRAVYWFDDAAARWRTAGGVANIGQVLAFAAHHDRVIAATTSGVWRWVSGTTWTLMSDALASSPVDDRQVKIPAVAPDDSVWIADMGGIWKQGSGPYDWPVFPPPAPPGNDIINLYPEGSRVYVTTFQEGVGRWDGGSWRNWPAGTCGGACDTTFLSTYFAFALLVDCRDRVWVGTWASALEEFDDTVPPQFVHHFVDDPVTEGRNRHSFAYAAELDRACGHWFGLITNGITEPTVGLGLDYYDSTGAYVRNFRPDSVASMRGTDIRALLWDGDHDRMLVGYSGGSRGLDYFQWSSFLADGVPDFQPVDVPASLEVLGLARHGDSLWVLSTSGLRRYSAGGLNLFATFAKPGAAALNSLHPLDVGPDGTVWIGSENGLRALHPGNQVEDFTVANSPLLDNAVKSVRVDPATGVVWIATGSGLNRFDPGYVPPSEALPERLAIQVYPNPAMVTALGVPFRLRGNAGRYDVEVLDVNGRRVRRMGGVGNDQAFWNGRDDSGRTVRPGLYFVRVTSGGLTATTRVTVLR